ncbi:cytochrome P450 [Nioella aestuarii]|uniref:cytochrome P450 n=1 Tax=Nioella aestuarii TaxID=1662864 RepID=UPI003D7F3FE8
MGMVEGHRRITPPDGMPVWDVDPYDPGILQNPLSYYSELRSKGEPVYLPRYSVLAVGRYETTQKVFSDHENFVSSRGVGLNDFKLEKPWRKPSIILEVDPPEHTRTRKVMARALSQKVVKGFAELFRDTAERIVDSVLEKGTIEAVSEFAEVFPTTVFPKAVGMHDSNARYLVDYGAMVFNAVGPDNEIRRRSMEKETEIVAWINGACARDRLSEDGLGARIYADADAGEITHDEASMLVRSFLSAGVDTTVTGIGSALWCLSQNPGEWERLKADPSLLRPAFDEVLRYTSPVHTFGRTAGRDTEIAGFPVEEGTKILCVLGAANMDPDKWEDPQSFRVDRRPRGHLGFGAGIHGCVGQNIARGELEAVLKVLIEKVDRIEPAGEAVWRPNNSIHALDTLPITFIPN